MIENKERPAVLVVDDDPDQCMLLELALEARGWSVTTAASRREAIAALTGRQFDALVCDLTLGDGSAIDVLDSAGARRPTVAAVLSGFDSEDYRARSVAAGFDAYLVKPTPLDELADTLASGLARARHSGGLAKASLDRGRAKGALGG